MKRHAVGFLATCLLIGILVSGQEGRRRITFPKEGAPWYVIDELVKGGQAVKLGLKPLDIILTINGQGIHNRQTLMDTLQTAKDVAIRIDIFRDGRPSLIEGRLEGESLGVSGTYVGVDKVLTPREMKSDLDLFFSSLVDIHPNIYVNLPREKFDVEKEKIYACLKKDLPVIEFWKLAASFVAKIGDGHTSLVLPSGDWGKSLYSGETAVFPLVPFISQDGVLVRENLSTAPIQKGDWIVSINGIPVDKILEEDERYTSGELRNFRLSMIEFFFPKMLFYVQGFRGPFLVTIKDAQGWLNDYKIQGTDKWSYDAAVAKFRDSEFHFEEFPELRLGVIRFRNFVDAGRFDAFLKNVFGTMKAKGYSYLVIDLQNNGGGASIIAEKLLDYITDKPYRYFGGAHAKVHAGVVNRYPEDYPDDKVGTVMTWDDLDLKTPEKKEDRLQGKVFVLVGSPTFSAASGFAAVIKDFKLGTLVGQETGGLPTCFGDFWPVFLPNSGLELRVSWKYFIRPNANKDYVLRGLVPDISVPTTGRDLLLGLNPALEKVKELIREDMRQKTGGPKNAVAPCPPGVFSFEPDERIFTIFAFMNAAGFDWENRDEGMHPLRAEIRTALKAKLDEAFQKKIREFYQNHKLSFRSYGVYGLLLSNPPELKLTGDPGSVKEDFEKLAGLDALLRAFYAAADIPSLWKKYAPVLREANESFRPFADRALEDIVSYCRVAPDYFQRVAEGFQFDFCPLLPYWTAWTATSDRKLYIVDGPSDNLPGPGAFYHEALHHVINPLMVKFMFEADHLKALQSLAKEQLGGNYPEWGSLVEECVVRTIDRILGGKYYKQSEDQILERIQREYKLGFILCPAFYEGFAQYEHSGEPLERYFPRLFSGINAVKEKDRWKRFWAELKK